MNQLETIQTWRERALALIPDGRAVINGKRVQALDAGTVDTINPATGEKIADLSSCSGRDVDAAVQAARTAFGSGSWSRIDAAERKAVLLRLAGLMEARTEEFALLETLDTGKPLSQTLSVDVPGTISTLRWYAEAADKLCAEIPSTPPGSTAMVTREPLGVVGAIVPWNFPLEIAGWKLAPALVAGNSVVLKPAEQSSLTALLLAELAIEAGLPAGVLNVVPGSGRVVGEAMGLHPDIDVLTFTGSTAVAKRLMEYSARSNMKRLSLEAGGKSSNIIFDDVEDVVEAAGKAAFGAFYNQGQVCSANSKIFVQRGVYDAFMAALVQAAAAYEPGDPLDPMSGNGSVISEAHAGDIETAIALGAADGRIVAGGGRLAIGGSTAYIQPTIVTGLASDHRLQHEEVFGPVVTVTVFDTEEEAITAANDTVYGLAASVWTSNLGRAHRVSKALMAGTVSVNTVDALGNTTPFGGFKQSGFGRDLSLHAIDNYVGLKTTWFQHG